MIGRVRTFEEHGLSWVAHPRHATPFDEPPDLAAARPEVLAIESLPEEAGSSPDREEAQSA